jgi:hypothetical protein
MHIYIDPLHPHAPSSNPLAAACDLVVGLPVIAETELGEIVVLII